MNLKTLFINLYSKFKGYFTLQDLALRFNLEYLNNKDIIVLFSVTDSKVFDQILKLYPNLRKTKTVIIEEEIFCILYNKNIQFSDFSHVSRLDGSFDHKGRRIVYFEMTKPCNVFITMCHLYYDTSKTIKEELLSDVKNYHKPVISYITYDPLL